MPQLPVGYVASSDCSLTLLGLSYNRTFVLASRI